MEGYRRKARRDNGHTEVWGYKTEVTEIIQLGKGHVALRNKVKRDSRGVKRRDGNENVFARPNELRENAESVISCRGPGPARKKEVRIPVVGRSRRMHRCALVAKQ